MVHDPRSPPALDAEEIRSAVELRLEKYKDRSFLERFALFVGMAQILEFGLKGLMHRKYGVEQEHMECWTLGKTAHELRTRGLRPDFCHLLDSVVRHRNHIAHKFLANQALFRALSGTDSRSEDGELGKAAYELEQLMFLHDWCEDNAAWD